MYMMGLPGRTVPPPSLLTFADARAYIRGVTVVNQSSVTLGLYINRQPVGSPDILIIGGLAMGVPVPNAKLLGVNFLENLTNPPSGQIYLHYTTDLVVSTASQLSPGGGATAIWDQAIWDSSSWG